MDVTYVYVHQIVAYVLSSYEIQYSVSGLTKWLHQNRFSYKQPKGVPHKFDPEKQAQFIEDYKRLKAKLAEDEPFAVHPTQATKITSGWIKTGVDKPIETTGSRTRLNIIGAIQLGNLSEAVTEEYDTVNSASIVDFFEQIKARYASSSCINIILDGPGYHRSDQVINKAKELNIKLHYGYKPHYLLPVI